MLEENMRMRVYINAKKVERSDFWYLRTTKISILRKLSGNFGNIAGININCKIIYTIYMKYEYEYDSYGST